MMKWAVMKKKTDGFTRREKAIMEELCGAMLERYAKLVTEYIRERM